MRFHVLAPSALCAALVLGGCTAKSTDDGLFVLPSTDAVECQEHQEEEPGVAYTGGEAADTVKIFSLLKYWTAHGDKPYCDGEPATDIDSAWRAEVERLQGRSPAPSGSSPAEPAPTTT